MSQEKNASWATPKLITDESYSQPITTKPNTNKTVWPKVLKFDTELLLLLLFSPLSKLTWTKNPHKERQTNKAAKLDSRSDSQNNLGGMDSLVFSVTRKTTEHPGGFITSYSLELLTHMGVVMICIIHSITGTTAKWSTSTMAKNRILKLQNWLIVSIIVSILFIIISIKNISKATKTCKEGWEQKLPAAVASKQSDCILFPPSNHCSNCAAAAAAASALMITRGHKIPPLVLMVVVEDHHHHHRHHNNTALVTSPKTNQPTKTHTHTQRQPKRAPTPNPPPTSTSRQKGPQKESAFYKRFRV